MTTFHFRSDSSRPSRRRHTKGKLAAFFLLLPLAGCFDSKTEQLANCEVEANQVFLHVPAYLSEHFGDYIQVCMEKAGYQLDPTRAECPRIGSGLIGFQTMQTDLQANPGCYSWRS
jgi:hypothetical protein